MVGVAVGPPLAQLFWVVAYRHLDGRVVARGQEGCHSCRRKVPLSASLVDRLKAAQLDHRIVHGQSTWRADGQDVKSGPILHSLVLARPGRHRPGCFDFEEGLFLNYYRKEVYSLEVEKVWLVDEASPSWMTLLHPDASQSYPAPFLMKYPVGFPRAGEHRARCLPIGIRLSSSEVVEAFGHGETPPPYVILVEQLACLLVAGQ